MTHRDQSITTVALVGNTFIDQRVSGLRDESFAGVVELLRDSDVTIANLECCIPAPADPPAFVGGQGWAATHLRADPKMLDELKFLGIDMLSAATNHSTDFGEAGILSTIRHLERAGFPFAGIGANLAAASRAAYTDSPNGLKIALIVACDWGPRWALGLNFPWPLGVMASDDAPPFRPRPGVNLLRYDAVSHVPPSQLDNLRDISQALGWEEDKVLRSKGFLRSHALVGFETNVGVEVDSATEFHFLGRKFVADDSYSQSIVSCDADVDRICKSVKEARSQADIVFVALHDQSHGYIDAMNHIQHLGQRAIDSGADVYYCNGGDLMGVEFYKGKPLIYGIPTFFLQTEAVRDLPTSVMARYGLAPAALTADFIEARDAHKNAALAATGRNRWHERTTGTSVHFCAFDGRARLQEIRVQPLDQWGGNVMAIDKAVPVPRFRRGLPLMPDPDGPIPERVLGRLQEESRRYGTDVEIKGGVGIVRPPGDS